MQIKFQIILSFITYEQQKFDFNPLQLIPIS